MTATGPAYNPTRPVMGAEEFNAHRVKRYGRDYAVSDDGFDDMAVARSRGWTTHSSWGRDGWDLGTWPYVSIHVRVHDGRYEVLTIVEGDHDVYSFDSEADQHAAMDYLFLWYAADQAWCPVRGSEGRQALDAGTAVVDVRFRGPFSPARLDKERQR